MFPHRKYLLDYLHDFRRKLNINVRFNTEVSQIERKPSDVISNRKFSMRDQNNNRIHCRFIEMLSF